MNMYPAAMTPKGKASSGTLTLGGIVPPEPPPAPKPGKERTSTKPKKKPPAHPACMTDYEFRAITKLLSCNAMTIGRICNANERTARRWANGELVIPPAVASLVRLAAAVGREAPYAEIIRQLEQETENLKSWEAERLAFMAKQAKPSQG